MKILLLTADFDGPGTEYEVKFAQSVLNEKFTTYVFHFGKRNEPEKYIYRIIFRCPKILLFFLKIGKNMENQEICILQQ